MNEKYAGNIGDVKKVWRRRENLRIRGVLHEGKKRDEQFSKAPVPRERKYVLSPEEAEKYPYVAAYLVKSGGYLPPTHRGHKAVLKLLRAMSSEFGTLVFLRKDMPQLDVFPRKSPILGQHAREESKAFLGTILSTADLDAVPYRASLQWGEVTEHLHTHFVLPLCFVEATLAQRIHAAPHGIGGGCLIDDTFHGVVVSPGDLHLLRLSRYLTSDPDSRLRNREGENYLEALEEDLARKATSSERAARLGWGRQVMAAKKAAEKAKRRTARQGTLYA